MPPVLVTCAGVCLDFYAVVVKTKQRVKIVNAPAKVNKNPKDKADTYNADDLIYLFIFQLLHAYSTHENNFIKFGYSLPSDILNDFFTTLCFYKINSTNST